MELKFTKFNDGESAYRIIILSDNYSLLLSVGSLIILM